jgi:DNA repair exonuclease SbcCD nuclease subunit
MKAFMITDTHFGIYPIKYDIWLKMMVDYFDNFFIPLLKERAEEGDILIHLGDLYDNRTQIPIDVLNTVERIMVEISEILPVHMIVGNHDIFNKSTNDVNSPKALRWVPNINVYEETTLLEVGGKELVMMPWVEKRLDQSNLLKRFSGADYLFCHSDLNGCRMHLNSVAWKNSNKIDVEDFSGYGHCYSGHIHIRQENKNFTFIGAPYQMDRNDVGDIKGVYILDIETGTEEFIENTLSPRFIKLEILKEEDIYKLESADTSKNYIDLSISNSLLINNRKVRRNIEIILEKGNFAKVEYINDIVKEDVKEDELEEDIAEIDLDNIKLDELEDIVLKYIEKQTYDSEEVKDGIINEYMKILNIYKEEYKFQKKKK